MNETFWRSPMTCPKCQAQGGRPFGVESKTAAKLLVLLRCDACGHEWTAERDTPLLTPPPAPKRPPEDSA
jgi:hypothetical protein